MLGYKLYIVLQLYKCIFDTLLLIIIFILLDLTNIHTVRTHLTCHYISYLQELHFLMIHTNFYTSLVSVFFLMMAQKWRKYI
jgi:hypothetical protein